MIMYTIPHTAVSLCFSLFNKRTWRLLNNESLGRYNNIIYSNHSRFSGDIKSCDWYWPGYCALSVTMTTGRHRRWRAGQSPFPARVWSRWQWGHGELGLCDYHSSMLIYNLQPELLGSRSSSPLLTCQWCEPRPSDCFWQGACGFHCSLC